MTHNTQLSASQIKLSNALAGYGTRNILCVTGQASFSLSGAEAFLDPFLQRYQVNRFSDFDVNPKFDDALRGADFARRAKIDVILAIGGGSVIDMAKLIKVFLADPDHAAEYVDGTRLFAETGIPLIAIPTTAGSGSEATHFAVVYRNGQKYSLAAPALLPNVQILDGGLIASNSVHQKTIQALDAAAQAIESYWARGSTDESRSFATQALQLLWPNFDALVRSDDPADLDKLIMASNFAGRAINLSKTTAAHAFSYAFTSHFAVPHGHAVWLTLPQIFDIHQNATPDIMYNINEFSDFQSRMKDLRDLLGLPSGPAQPYLRNWLGQLGIEPNMAQIQGITTAARRELSDQVNQERLRNNPVRFTDNHIENIFSLRRVQQNQQ